MPNIREFTSRINSLTPRPGAAENLAAAGRAKGKIAKAWGEAIADGLGAIGRGVASAGASFDRERAKREAEQEQIDNANTFANITSISAQNDIEFDQLESGTGDPNDMAGNTAEFIAKKEGELDALLESARGTPQEAYVIRQVAEEKAKLRVKGYNANSAATSRIVLEGADIGYNNLKEGVIKDPSTLGTAVAQWDDYAKQAGKASLDPKVRDELKKAAANNKQDLIETALGAAADKDPEAFLADAAAGKYDQFTKDLGTASYNNVETPVIEIIKDRAERNIAMALKADKAMKKVQKEADNKAADLAIAEVLTSTTKADGTHRVPPGAYERVNELYNQGAMTQEEYRANINYLDNIADGAAAKTDDPETAKALYDAFFSWDPNGNKPKPTQKQLRQLAIEKKITPATYKHYSDEIEEDAKSSTGKADMLKMGRDQSSKMFDYDAREAGIDIVYGTDGDAKEMALRAERAEAAYHAWFPSAVKYYTEVMKIPEAELYDPQSPNWIVKKFNDGMQWTSEEIDARRLSTQKYKDQPPLNGGVDGAPAPRTDKPPPPTSLSPQSSLGDEDLFQPTSLSSFYSEPTETLEGSGGNDQLVEGVVNVDLKSVPARTALLADQAGYVVHELKNYETGAYAKLQRAKSVEQAVDAGIAYERPNPKYAHRSARVAAAKRIYAGKGSKAEMFVFNQLKVEGLTAIQAAGMAGNFVVESRMDPHIKGDNGTAIGLAQWRHERRSRMVAFVKKRQAARA